MQRAKRELLAKKVDAIIDLQEAASVEARAIAKELATLLLAKNFDRPGFEKLVQRLDGLGYPMPNVQTCMLSRYAMSVALGMDPKSADNTVWQEGFNRLGTAPFAVEQACREAQAMRAHHDGDEKALQAAVYKTFFPQGNIPK